MHCVTHRTWNCGYRPCARYYQRQGHIFPGMMVFEEEVIVSDGIGDVVAEAAIVDFDMGGGVAFEEEVIIDSCGDVEEVIVATDDFGFGYTDTIF